MVHIQGTGGDSLKYVGSEAAPPQEDPGTVPEPATLALLGLGMASLAWMRKRKK
ncbi:MAG TPA: PEP-CTERM sorting domain-containing protein [Nitrosospira sp.]|nr:PEP-CTERM sorting domain-containing protein [Nitrosospira sp.]